MIDTHCHVDLYPRPTEVADGADRAGVLTVIVTNLPSAFERALPFVQSMKNVRLALGLHPLAAGQHAAERGRFAELVDKTSYVGEVGLDFSRAGYHTKELQIESFKFVLRALRGKPKFVTLHSRQAESAVLDILEEEGRSPVVFHWYTGALSSLDRALSRGHYFSINPAMVGSPKGRKIVGSIPADRVLTETDGPFVKVNNRSAIPSDVTKVEDYLAEVWRVGRLEARARIRENFLRLVRPVRIIKGDDQSSGIGG
jgi:TatD DNase family protein